MTLLGKGFYIWQIPRCERGDPNQIALKARSAGLSHVLIKIADSTLPYNVDKETKFDYVPAVVERLRQVDIQVWGWQYIRGHNPEGEARMAVQRYKELGLDGFVIDAEVEFKKPGKASAARRYMTELRRGLPNEVIALSTYRYPYTHPEIPYSEFLAGCDIAMPQVYFEKSHNPEAQLTRCVEQYMSLNPARPVIPTAPAYKAGDWKPTPDDLYRFLSKAREMGLFAANAWSWDFASRTPYRDLWNAIAAFEWPAKPPAADMPERLFGRLNQQDPKLIAGLYHEKAAHVTGQRTIVGRDSIRKWYGELLKNRLPAADFKLTGKNGSGKTRHFTWNAESSKGVVIDGNDTIGINEGRIYFHYSYYTVREGSVAPS